MSSRPPTSSSRVHLGYLVVETEKFADWRRFGRDAIGMHLGRSRTGGDAVSHDGNECRFLAAWSRRRHHGTGLGTRRPRHLRAIEARVRSHGVPLIEVGGGGSTTRASSVSVGSRAPNGLRQEIYVSARQASGAVAVGRQGFVTGVDGMGTPWPSRRRSPHQMRGYYSTVFGRTSLLDYIDETISGLKFKIRFLRVNERHHSVAIASVNRLPINPIRTSIQHCNIQAAELDDMTWRIQRVKQLGLRYGTVGWG